MPFGLNFDVLPMPVFFIAGLAGHLRKSVPPRSIAMHLAAIILLAPSSDPRHRGRVSQSYAEMKRTDRPMANEIPESVAKGRIAQLIDQIEIYSATIFRFHSEARRSARISVLRSTITAAQSARRRNFWKRRPQSASVSGMSARPQVLGVEYARAVSAIRGAIMADEKPAKGQSAGSTPAAHWGYEPHNGPELWGALDREYSACGLGAEQSPIDLTGGQWADLTPVEFDYGRTRLAIRNTGHTIQMRPGGGNGIVLDGVGHNLLEFHFHHRSEHLVDGASFPLEMHLVHRNVDDGLAVVGILIFEGEINNALASVWSRLPPDPGALRALPGEFDLASLLPSFRTTWRYRGSLTTPPCTEGVSWVVLDAPLPMSAAQIATFASIYPCNCRPVQPLGERTLYRG